jgi:hypothetical protein
LLDSSKQVELLGYNQYSPQKIPFKKTSSPSLNPG